MLPRLARSIGENLDVHQPADARIVLDSSGRKVRLKPNDKGLGRKAAKERSLGQEFYDKFPKDYRGDRRHIYLREWLAIGDMVSKEPSLSIK